MTRTEENQLQEEIQQCRQQRRLRASTIQAVPEEVQPGLQEVDDWEGAIHREWSSLISHNAVLEGTVEDGATASGSIQNTPGEGTIQVEHASVASHTIVTSRYWNSNPLPRGTVLQRNLQTGRTRLVLTGEFIPDEEDHTVSAINVAAVKGDHTDDHYCMLDSGANVMVIPWKEGMKGDHTMCALDNRTEGLVVARLSTRHRTHLIVAVKEARPLIPISYLIRIAHYRATWRMMGEHDCFQMKDGYGDPVTVTEDEDLLYVGKTTLWRIGYDLYNSALANIRNDMARCGKHSLGRMHRCGASSPHKLKQLWILWNCITQVTSPPIKAN